MPTLSWTTVSPFSPAESRDRWNNFRQRLGTYTGPSSYVTGGDSINLGIDFGLTRVNQVILGLAFDGTNIRLLRYNPTTQKIQWFVPNTGAEVGAATDLDGFTAAILVIGN